MKSDPLYVEALATFDRLLMASRGGRTTGSATMFLATATKSGLPSLRTVLLREHNERGFVFYTRLMGRKGGELVKNPNAALLFRWSRVEGGVQIRIEGTVTQVDDAEADANFALLDRRSKTDAWATQQSHPLASREALDLKIAEAVAHFDKQEVPRPPDWTGFRVAPNHIEIWHARNRRFPERWVYSRAKNGHWSKQLLFP